MKRFFLFSLAMALFLGTVASCSKMDMPLSRDAYFAREGLTAYFDTMQFRDPVAYLGGLKSKDESWIRARAGSKLISAPLSADILILGNSVLDANLPLVKNAYNKGKIILVANPDLEKLKAFRDTLKWNFALPDSLPKEDCAFGFAKNNSILLTAPSRIVTDLSKHEGVQSEIEVKGDVVYENASVFCSATGLMNFIRRVKTELSDAGKSSVSATALDEKANTLTYEYPRSMYWETVMRGRYLRVFNSFNVSYSVYPCYVPEGVNNHGDYYVVKAVATNYAPTMYEYKEGNPNVPAVKGAHYWPREYSYWGDCQFRGPYNTKMNILACAKTPSDLNFAASGRPVPGTDIDTRTYSETKSFEWNIGISGGFSEGDGFGIGFNAGLTGSKSNTVQYSMSDIRVVNNSDNNSVKYDFVYQNLPKKDDDFDNYESKMPSICKSTADFGMQWEWTTSAIPDYDGTIIPLYTEVNQSLDIWARDKDTGIWHNYMNSYTIPSSSTNTSLLNLARIPIGCLRILNKCQTNQVLYQIKVNDSASGDVLYEGTNNVARGEYFEVLLPQKNYKYSVSLDLGKSSYETVTYYSYDSAIEIPLLLSSAESDKKVLSFIEGGGDFTSKAGFLRVMNQSTINLVRNLMVFDANHPDKPVYYRKSSLGFGQYDDIYLNSNTEYFVTMEFGSVSQMKPYKSTSFKLDLYQSESDIYTLIANDNNGGDFILQ